MMTNTEAIAYIHKAKELLKGAPGPGFSTEDKKLLTTDKQFEIPNLVEES